MQPHINVGDLEIRSTIDYVVLRKALPLCVSRDNVSKRDTTLGHGLLVLVELFYFPRTIGVIRIPNLILAWHASKILSTICSLY